MHGAIALSLTPETTFIDWVTSLCRTLIDVEDMQKFVSAARMMMTMTVVVVVVVCGCGCDGGACRW